MLTKDDIIELGGASGDKRVVHTEFDEEDRLIVQGLFIAFICHLHV